MAETDDIVARLSWLCSPWAEATSDGERLTALIRAGQEAATALTERDAQIERLTREVASLERELDDAEEEGCRTDDKIVELEARATTAERERDEARAEVERLKAAELSGISGDLENRIAAALYADGSDLCDVPWELVPGHMKVGYFSAAKRISAALTKGGENGEG